MGATSPARWHSAQRWYTIEATSFDQVGVELAGAADSRAHTSNALTEIRRIILEPPWREGAAVVLRIGWGSQKRWTCCAGCQRKPPAGSKAGLQHTHAGIPNSPNLSFHN